MSCVIHSQPRPSLSISCFFPLGRCIACLAAFQTGKISLGVARQRAAHLPPSVPYAVCLDANALKSALFDDEILLCFCTHDRCARVCLFACLMQGWFESVYLDQDLRVTRDVRGDVTVLVKSQSHSKSQNQSQSQE